MHSLLTPPRPARPQLSREPDGLAAATDAHSEALLKADEDEISRAELAMLAIMMRAQFGNAEVSVFAPA